MREAGVEYLRNGQLNSIDKNENSPALGAVDASSSLLALFPGRGAGLGSSLRLPLALLVAGSGGGGTSLEARCDDLRAMR
jgi:hypothetical protein